MYPNLFYCSLKITCLRNVQNFIDVPSRVLILKRESTNFLIISRFYANPLLLCTILERDMMSIFPTCVKNVRLQALSNCVEFSRRLMQEILDLLSCDLSTSKDHSYRAESA